jgi:hypothetical protein
MAHQRDKIVMRVAHYKFQKLISNEVMEPAFLFCRERAPVRPLTLQTCQNQLELKVTDTAFEA